MKKRPPNEPALIVYNILIPCTEDATGFAHPPEKFDVWLLDTVEVFGGASVLGLAVRGLWFDPALPHDANPVEDHSNWYKVAVPPARVEELRGHVARTATAFGQKCIYFERAGEVEFVWDPRQRRHLRG